MHSLDVGREAAAEDGAPAPPAGRLDLIEAYSATCDDGTVHTGDQARDFAQVCLDGLEPRWSHVQGVGRLAEDLIEHHGMSEAVAVAAWLHDVGYGEALVVTGFHPLDGAKRLLGEWGDEIVGLVAWHTGAAFEAK